ncbi:MAG: ribonuclease HI [Verrucomicrobiia bacterium]|jgi:ribonuclease HI
MKHFVIHTDGACEGNPGPGGWAAILRCDGQSREVAGGEPATTNNRMELQAAIAALNAVEEPCEIEFFTDSEYLRKGVTQWLRLWKARAWRTVSRQPVKNDDLWRQLDQLAAPHRITWKWLKGHAGHVENERCDELAGLEIAKLRQRHTPQQLAALKAGFDATRSPLNSQGLLF